MPFYKPTVVESIMIKFWKLFVVLFLVQFRSTKALIFNNKEAALIAHNIHITLKASDHDKDDDTKWLNPLPTSLAQNSRRIFSDSLKASGLVASTLLAKGNAAQAAMRAPRWGNDGITPNSRTSQGDDFVSKASETAALYFPGATDGNVILQKVTSVFEKRGVTSENTLFAQSVCSDEINHEIGDLPSLFRSYLGKREFQLGGLGGIPFTGKTGYSAFSHHVPAKGNIFILFAPHVGVSNDLQLGQYNREGQAQSGASCGAAVGAYNRILADKNKNKNSKEKKRGTCDAFSDPFDYQQQYIVSEIAKVSDSIDAKDTDNEKMAVLANEMFLISKRFINEIVNIDDPDTKVFILGGVMINMPKPSRDFFQPLMFEMRTANQKGEDLMGVFR